MRSTGKGRARLIVWALLAAAGALAATCVLPAASAWLRVDRCLDLGGRWDDASRSCQLAEHGVTGRLVLRDAAADQLGMRDRVLRQVDSLGVPLAVRLEADQLRHETGGDATAAVRYYRGRGGQLAALVPSRSFEGEDPHVVAAFGADGDPRIRAALPSYTAVELYCPASGQTHADAWSRDSTDGCRYFRPLSPEAAPEDGRSTQPARGV